MLRGCGPFATCAFVWVRAAGALSPSRGLGGESVTGRRGDGSQSCRTLRGPKKRRYSRVALANSRDLAWSPVWPCTASTADLLRRLLGVRRDSTSIRAECPGEPLHARAGCRRDIPSRRAQRARCLCRPPDRDCDPRPRKAPMAAAAIRAGHLDPPARRSRGNARSPRVLARRGNHVGTRRRANRAAAPRWPVTCSLLVGSSDPPVAKIGLSAHPNHAHAR